MPGNLQSSAGRRIPTDAQIARVKWSAQPQTIYIKNGLRLVAYPDGRKVWLARWRNNGREIVRRIGEWPSTRTRAARAELARLKRAAALGLPVDGARVSAQTLAQFSDRYMAEVVQKRRKTPETIQRWLDREILPPLGAKPLKLLTAADVRGIVFRKRDAGRPAAAAAMLDLMKRVFDYAMVCGLVESNPAKATPRRFVGRLRPRTRVLDQAELRLFLSKVVDARLGSSHSIALRLLLLTLCRKSELLRAKWGDVDLEKGTIEIRPEESKSGRSHVVFLSRQAQALLCCLRPLDGCNTQECIFPAQSSRTQPASVEGINKAMARVKWGMARFTPHDLRRTACTMLYELGYRSEWIEKAMNHAVAGVKGVYNKAQYAEERRAMLQAWGDFLEGLNGF